MRRLAVVSSVVVALVVGSPKATAAPVDLELVLAMDVSGSVDAADFDLLRSGYEAAFRSAAVIDRIEAGLLGSIAVTLVQWSDAAVQSVGWTVISDAASSNAFADAIAAMPRSSSGGTGMVNAITFSTALFANDFEGTREVLDVSGDGAESNACSFSQLNCVPLQNARDAFLAGPNRTINAIWIDDRDFFGDDPEDIINALAYGSLNVIGGSGAFQGIAQDFNQFQSQILNKIAREITPVPEPVTWLLLGTGIVALARRGRQG